MTFFEIFALLCFGHFMGDYAFQSQFMAEGKNHMRPIPGVPWYQVLFAHSAIHAGIVGIITGSLWLAMCELFVHFVTDHEKCEGKFGFNADQAIHVFWKAVWALLVVLL